MQPAPLLQAASLVLHKPCWCQRSGAVPADSPAAVTIGVGNASWTGAPRILAWYPLVIAYDSFLSDAECDHVLRLAQPAMEPAMLINRDTHKHRKSPSRTSHGAFFDDADDPLLATLSQRIAHAVQLPASAALAFLLLMLLTQHGAQQHLYGARARCGHALRCRIACPMLQWSCSGLELRLPPSCARAVRTNNALPELQLYNKRNHCQLIT